MPPNQQTDQLPKWLIDSMARWHGESVAWWFVRQYVVAVAVTEQMYASFASIGYLHVDSNSYICTYMHVGKSKQTNVSITWAPRFGL